MDKMSLGAGALKVEGPIYSTKEEHCLGSNHDNQVSANHTALSHWKSSVEYLPQTILTYPGGWGEEWEQKPVDITDHE